MNPSTTLSIETHSPAASSSEKIKRRASTGQWFSRSMSVLPSFSAEITPTALQAIEHTEPRSQIRSWATTTSAFERLPQAVHWFPFNPFPGNGYYEAVQELLTTIETCAKNESLHCIDHTILYPRIFTYLHSLYCKEQKVMFPAPIFFLAFRLTREAVHTPSKLTSSSDIWKATHNPSPALREAACMLVGQIQEIRYAIDHASFNFKDRFKKFDLGWHIFLEVVIREKEARASSWFGIDGVERMLLEIKNEEPSAEKYRQDKLEVSRINQMISNIPKIHKLFLLNFIDYFLKKMKKPYSHYPRRFNKDSVNLMQRAIKSGYRNDDARNLLNTVLQKQPHSLFDIATRLAVLNYADLSAWKEIHPDIFPGSTPELLRIKHAVKQIQKQYPIKGLPTLIKYTIVPGMITTNPNDLVECNIISDINKLGVIEEINLFSTKLITEKTCKMYGLIQQSIHLSDIADLPKAIAFSFLAQKIIRSGMKMYTFDWSGDSILDTLALEGVSNKTSLAQPC